jgi:hypothetical protein
MARSSSAVPLHCSRVTDHRLAKGLDIESKSLFLDADLAPKPAKVNDDDQDALSQLS